MRDVNLWRGVPDAAAVMKASGYTKRLILVASHSLITQALGDRFGGDRYMAWNIWEKP